VTTFIDEHKRSLDDKGRLILPSTYREGLDHGLVMTVWTERCLAVYPWSHWEQVIENLRSMESPGSRERRLARMVTSSAHHQTPDRQGRITVPQRLREYAGLWRDVAVVGADVRVELWNAEAWEAYRGEGLPELAETDQPFELGIF
jgi:MraZ protein